MTGKKKGSSKPMPKKQEKADANINTHDGSSPERDDGDKIRNNDDSLDDYYQVRACFLSQMQTG